MGSAWCLVVEHASCFQGRLIESSGRDYQQYHTLNAPTATVLEDVDVFAIIGEKAISTGVLRAGEVEMLLQYDEGISCVCTIALVKYGCFGGPLYPRGSAVEARGMLSRASSDSSTRGSSDGWWMTRKQGIRGRQCPGWLDVSRLRRQPQISCFESFPQYPQTQT